MKLFRLFKRNKKNEPVSIDNSDDIQLIHIYTDSTGNKYYAYKNPVELPAIRALAIERTTRFAGMYVSEPTLREAVKQMKEAGNRQDISKLFSILQELEYRLEYLSEEETLLEIASYYFFDQTEDPMTVIADTIKAKITRWKNDIEAMSFFLQSAFRLIQKHSQLSADDLLMYLKENERHSRRLYDLLQTN